MGVLEHAKNWFGADEVAQKEFLLNGIVTAHARDQQDKIDQDKEATEAEKARLAARDAKSRAAAVLGIVATESLLILSDDRRDRDSGRARPLQPLQGWRFDLLDVADRCAPDLRRNQGPPACARLGAFVPRLSDDGRVRRFGGQAQLL